MEIWVKSDPYRKELITFALERGISTFWLSPGHEEGVRKLGRVRVVSEDGDVVPGEDFELRKIECKEDVEEISTISNERMVYIEKYNREIIPLENLVALGKRIFVPVANLEDLRVSRGVLEKGVQGIVIEVSTLEEMGTLLKELGEEEISLKMKRGVIKDIQILGLGDRVCVDTCSLMAGPKGMLVGNSSSGYFLVSAENVHSEYVNERPFRVNAGAVHMYTLLPGGRTSYLSEVKGGSQILVVRSDGKCEVAWVGRAKIERRPLLLVIADIEGGEISAILQNAETIRLVTPGGEQVSVSDIVKGTEIACYTEEGGRHFGIKVEETIEEK